VLTTFIVAQAFVGIAVNQTELEVGHGAHLAVYFRFTIKTNQVEDYGHKGSDAREGVNLSQERINPLLWVGGASDD
jgi:hypothetical protein